MTSEKWMREALEEARLASSLGEVPVGAVVVCDDEIVARAHNEVELRQDATAHAEMLALQRASAALGTWRLENVSLFVTLEPCTMCTGALVLARVRSLYFGCYDPKQGAVGSLYDLSRHLELAHQMEVFPGLLAQEAQDLLKSFFVGIRKV
jgi:tRNA(adenine34) deaminase